MDLTCSFSPLKGLFEMFPAVAGMWILVFLSSFSMKFNRPPNTQVHSVHFLFLKAGGCTWTITKAAFAVAFPCLVVNHFTITLALHRELFHGCAWHLKSAGYQSTHIRCGFHDYNIKYQEEHVFAWILHRKCRHRPLQEWNTFFTNFSH